MSDRPHFGLGSVRSGRSPPGEQVTAMDVVGQVVTAVRTGLPFARRRELYGKWGLRFRGDHGAGFHVVLEGSAWIVPPTVSTPVKLGVGDVVFVGNTDGYTVADH